MGKLKDLKDKFLSLLYKTQSEDIRFSNDYLALIRIGCLGATLFSIGNVIFLYVIFNSPLLALALSLIIVGMLCLFVISYFQRKHFLVTVTAFCILAALMLTLLAFWFGAQIGYHLGILILIFVAFYQTNGRKKSVEFVISLMFILYSYGVWYYVIFNGSRLPVSKQDNLILSIGYMLWIGLSVVTLAWFYHVKFAKNEDDLLKYNDQLKAMTKCDALTKLQNRRGITEEVDKLLKSSTDLFFIMCDIDFFKKVNDNYGHDIGDRVLVKVSEIIQSHLEKGSILGRWGGEEFLIVIPNRTQQQVIDRIETIRMQIARETFVITKDKEFFVTMTFGIAQHYFNKYTAEESIKRADENLYLGKQRGRNCVIF